MSDLAKLGGEVERLASGRGRRYPPPLKRRIVDSIREAREHGWAWSLLAEELGIPGDTLRRWLDNDGGNFSEMKPVVVAEPVQIEAAATIVVVTPSGFRVEGLNVEGAATLIRELS